MSLADIIRNGIALADGVTKSLQPEVTFEAWTGQDDTGAPTYASAKRVRCVVERRRSMRRLDDGQEKASSHVLTVMQPVKDTTPSTGFARENPIDPRDRFTLTDGTTAPIIDVQGVVDADSDDGHRYYHEVYLG